MMLARAVIERLDSGEETLDAVIQRIQQEADPNEVCKLLFDVDDDEDIRRIRSLFAEHPPLLGYRYSINIPGEDRAAREPQGDDNLNHKHCLNDIVCLPICRDKATELHDKLRVDEPRRRDQRLVNISNYRTLRNYVTEQKSIMVAGKAGTTVTNLEELADMLNTGRAHHLLFILDDKYVLFSLLLIKKYLQKLSEIAVILTMKYEIGCNN